MFKKLLSAGCLVLALAGCASAPRAPDAAKSVAAAKAPPGCVPETATRIPVSPSGCAGFGRTYTQEDIQRTGAGDTAQALRLLDPSLTVHGH